MMTHRMLASVLMAALVVSGCDDGEGGDEDAGIDAGEERDAAAPPDAGPSDSGTDPDAGGDEDAGSDAATADGGGGTAMVVLNEIAPDDPVGEDWIEIYNAGDAAADLSGWYFTDDDPTHVFTFADGTTLAPGEYLVVEGGGPPGFDFGLGRGGDAVSLYDAEGAAIDTTSWVEPDADAPNTWGRYPNGTGAFSARTVATKDAENVANPARVVINEVVPDDPVGEDWIELFNAGEADADLSGWYFTDDDPTHVFTFAAGTMLAAGDYLVVEGGGPPGFDFGLGRGGDTVALYDSSDASIDSTSWVEPDADAPNAWGRYPNGTGPFSSRTVVTRGAENAPNPAP